MLFADDLIIVQENEDNLQKSIFELQKISSDYNLKISTTKTQILAFRGKYPVRSKIILNGTTLEQVAAFNYLGCYVTYNEDKDLSVKLNKFQSICGVISRVLGRTTRKETSLKFYKTVAVPALFYGCETWTLREKDWNRIQASEMKFLRAIKGCNRSDRIRNEDIRQELGVTALREQLMEYRTNWKDHIRRMDNSRIPLQAYKYRPVGYRDIGRPRRRWKETVP